MIVQHLVAGLRSELNGDRRRSEEMVADLLPHECRMLALYAIVLLAQCVRVQHDNDQHLIDEFLSEMGLRFAQELEG